MPDQLQLRGGTTTEHNSFTGALREVTVDTTKKTVVVHDGASAGGTALMKESGGNAASSVQIGSGGVNALTIDGSQDITLTGASANVVWDKSANAFEFADNAKAIFGTGSDLQIYHDGNNSVIQNDTGDLYIQNDSSNTTSKVLIRAKAGENSINVNPDGAIELFYDNSKKFETVSNGILVTGKVECNDFISIAADNKKLKIGAGDDLQIYHDGSNSYLTNATGNLVIRNTSGDAGVIGIQPKSGENGIICRDDNNVELYFDNSKKLETYANGVNIATSAGSGDLSLNTGSNAMSLILDRNGRITAGIRGSDGNSNIGGSSGGGSRISLNKNLINFFTFPHVSNIGDSVTYTERFRVTSAGATVYGSLTESSDIALKENFRPITNTLEKLKEITGYIYNFKRVRGDIEHDSMGVIAQDVEKVFPEIVAGEEGKKTLQYNGLIGVLVEAVKELTDKVAALEAA